MSFDPTGPHVDAVPAGNELLEPAVAAPTACGPRERLLQEAGPVFANSGFERATVREICAAAKVNVASVAYYFGDKMGLYRAVVQQVRDARERRFPVPNNSADIDPEVALTRLIHTMLCRMLKGDQGGWETQLLMREMDHPTTVFTDLVNDFFRPLFGQLQRCIRGIVKTEVDESVIEQLAFSVVGQCVYHRVGRGVIEILIPVDLRESNYTVDALCKHITSMTIAAAKDASLQTYKPKIECTIQAIHQSENCS